MVRGLPQVAVGGDKAWNDPISMRVEHLRCAQGSGRVACGNSHNGSIFGNDEIAREGIALLGSHGKEACIPNQKLGRGGKKSGGRADGRGNQQSEENRQPPDDFGRIVCSRSSRWRGTHTLRLASWNHVARGVLHGG